MPQPAEEKRKPTSSKATVAGSPPTSNEPTDDPPPNAPTVVEDDGDDPRRVAHELLGQAHAVLTIAVRQDVLPHWCPPELQTSVADTAAQIALAVGDGHAAIASGNYDVAIREAGVGGQIARPKRKGPRVALERLIGVLGSARSEQIRSWLKAAAGWAKVGLTSLGKTLEKTVPGVEWIIEALDAVLSGIDTTEAAVKHDDRER